ncbi:hypothetical protein ACHAXA_008652 [Cyclostephanos tholiformis]|uniref:rRNA adenine N(6)-methyltransferase n=1 Tax=Cyclostephanos tholiformis TaxID=382380 RepID=A0ABD3RBX5_9STRA
MTTLPSSARRSSSSSFLLLLLLCSTLATRHCSSFGPSHSIQRERQRYQKQRRVRVRLRRHDDAMPFSSSSPGASSRVYTGGVGGGYAVVLDGWVQRRSDGEWTWEEKDDDSPPSSVVVVANVDDDDDASVYLPTARATPTLPSGTFRPKQSLGQNFLRDGNTVARIVRAFIEGGGDCRRRRTMRAVELGPGAGALTDVLVPTLLGSGGGRVEGEDDDVLGAAADDFRCIEIDARSVELLRGKHPNLVVIHEDVLRVDYRALADDGEGVTSGDDDDDIAEDGMGGDMSKVEDIGRLSGRCRHPTGMTTTTIPLSIIGNLPYYITSQILFALADASHSDSVKSATVTMQYEVGRRLVASTSTKDYGILSVVFQLYCTSVKMHFKIPPTVFYPQPKVDSALMGLHFAGSELLRRRLGGVRPRDLRSVVTSAFRQRRKTVRNGLRRLATEVYKGDADRVSNFLNGAPGPLPASVGKLRDEEGDNVALSQELPSDWASKRPEELTPGQFVEIARMLYGPAADDFDEEDGDGARVELGNKVWRKLKHGSN